MSVLDFLKGNFSSHASTGEWTPISENKGWRNLSSYQNSKTAAGISVTSDSAMNSAAAFACTRAIAETLASLPAAVIEQVSPEQRRKARQNAMWALLHDQPNPQMDSMTWYSLNAKRLVNRGNAVNLIEFNGRGLPIALWPVHNSRWEAYRLPSVATGNGRFIPGDVYYRIWPDETNRSFDVSSDEILNVVGFDTEDGICAKGVISRAKQEIALDIAEQEYAGSMFANGALPMGVVSHPWLKEKEQRDMLRADINAMHQGRESWNRVGILWDKDADWKKLSFSPEDVQAIESRAFTAKAICRYYNVPPAIVQIFDDYKFSTVEAMLKQFIMLTIRPHAVCFERAIKSQLLVDIPGEDLFLEFALEGLLRGDPKTQAEANAILRSWGVLNSDEWRMRDLNMNPLPNGEGQTYLAPLNYGPLDLVASGAYAKAPQEKDRKAEAKAAKWDKSFAAALMSIAKNQGTAAAAVPVAASESPASLSVERERFAWKVIDKQLARMIGNETNGIRRIVSKGEDGFLARVEEYYAKFMPALAEALEVGCEGLQGDAVALSAAYATAHCDESKQLLLAACGGDEFAGSMETCLQAWPARRIRPEEKTHAAHAA